MYPRMVPVCLILFYSVTSTDNILPKLNSDPNSNQLGPVVCF